MKEISEELKLAAKELYYAKQSAEVLANRNVPNNDDDKIMVALEYDIAVIELANARAKYQSLLDQLSIRW
jgi:phage terminase Nu1 subunit (DNA packaging protein)